MELNLILFVVFLALSPGFVFLIGKNDLVHKYPILSLFSVAYLFLSGYLLFYVSGITFLILVGIIGVGALIHRKVLQRWTLDKENSFFKNFLIVVGKTAVLLLGAYLAFVAIATTLAMYSTYYEKPIRDTDPNVNVEACRVDSDSCYMLKAHYVPEACAPVEYDTRGANGGQCYRDAYIEKIYFDNGGYISFESCNSTGKDKWLCFPDSNEEDDWNIEMTEGI